MQQTKGFSLIELMVVVAIIAILVAVASPSYKDYITRAKLSKGMEILRLLESQSMEYYSVNGNFPSLSDVHKISTDYAVGDIAWGDMGSSGWTGGDAASPYVEIQFATDVVPGQTAPRLALVATVNGSSVTWTCYTYDIGNIDSSISSKFLPTVCSVHS